MSDTQRDFRKIGGNRVTTAFNMVVANPDPFNTFSDRFSGTIVFNVRGGCLFIDNAGPLKAYTRIFGDGPVATLDLLELKIPNQDPAVIKKVKIKNARQKEVGGQEGIVFRFLQTDEKQLDLLNELVADLPNAESDVDVLQQRKKA